MLNKRIKYVLLRGGIWGEVSSYGMVGYIDKGIKVNFVGFFG